MCGKWASSIKSDVGDIKYFTHCLNAEKQAYSRDYSFSLLFLCLSVGNALVYAFNEMTIFLYSDSALAGKCWDKL